MVEIFNFKDSYFCSLISRNFSNHDPDSVSTFIRENFHHMYLCKYHMYHRDSESRILKKIWSHNDNVPVQLFVNSSFIHKHNGQKGNKMSFPIIFHQILKPQFLPSSCPVQSSKKYFANKSGN